MLIKPTKNMKKVIYVLILPLVVVSGLVFANRQIKNDTSKKLDPAKIVFRSTDGGQTWQDISQGLPENLQKDSIQGNSFFANDKGLFLRIGNGLYHNAPNGTAPFWTKENLPAEHSSIAPGKNETFANNTWSVKVKKTDGTSAWSPIFKNVQEPRIRSVFETAEGSIFIGTDKGFIKTTDKGKSWRLDHPGALVGHLAELNDILVGISDRGIIRSTDNGENWTVVMSEDIAWDVKKFKDGFVAITSSTESNTRKLMTSFDGGKTWQHGESSIQDKTVIDSIWRTWNDRPGMEAFMNSIIQVGENFFSPTNGIFRSSDKGKTWKLLLPSVENKAFNIFVSGTVIYAIPTRRGC